MRTDHVAAQSAASKESPLIGFRSLVDIRGKRDATMIAICGSYIPGFIAGARN